MMPDTLKLPPSDARIEVEGSGDLVWYRPSEGPGPVFKIASDGTLTVYRIGADNQDLAKLFWESVHFQGVNYNQKLAGAEQMLQTVYHDPARQLIHGGEYEIFKLLKDRKAGVSMSTVRLVLEAMRHLVNLETN